MIEQGVPLTSLVLALPYRTMGIYPVPFVTFTEWNVAGRCYVTNKGTDVDANADVVGTS